MVKLYILGLCVIAILLSGGCTVLTRRDVLMRVPFIPQSNPHHCGVACLEMALQYYGINYDPSELERQTYIPALSGSTPEIIADTAEKYGLSAKLSKRSLREIKHDLLSETLVIVFLPPEEGETLGHFVVATGAHIQQEKLVAHDGLNRNQIIPVKPDDAFTTIVLTLRSNEENQR